MIPTLVDYKNDKLDRRDKILLSVFVTIVLGLAAMALIPAASATITITPTCLSVFIDLPLRPHEDDPLLTSALPIPNWQLSSANS